jgi:hypothetical protein
LDVGGSPEAREKLVTEARIKEARTALRRVLTLRGLALAADEEAKIDACDALDTLERWLKQTFVAASAEEALR